MSEITQQRDKVEYALEELQSAFNLTAQRLTEKITAPEAALRGMATHSPLIEADFPLDEIIVDDEPIMGVVLHLEVISELHDSDVSLRGMFRQAFRRRPHQQTGVPVAIRAAVRHEFAEKHGKKIVPISDLIDVDLRNFDRDMHTGKLPSIEDVNTCKDMLDDINGLVTYIRPSC